MLLSLLIALLIVAGDQISKMQVVQHMQPGQDIPVINGILHLHYAQNNGAAFSMLQGLQGLLIAASILASLGIIIFLALRKTPIHWFGLLSLGLILGGALGNLIDRIRIHQVVDFIYVKVINFAIFNVADAGVSVGAVLMCIYLLFMHEKYVKKVRPQKEPDEPEEPVIEQTQG